MIRTRAKTKTTDNNKRDDNDDLFGDRYSIQNIDQRMNVVETYM